MRRKRSRCALLSSAVPGLTRVRGFGRFAARVVCAAAGISLAAASLGALNPATPIAQFGRDVWDSD